MVSVIAGQIELEWNPSMLGPIPNTVVFSANSEGHVLHSCSLNLNYSQDRKEFVTE